LILVVRFPGTLVQDPEPYELLARGISVTLVGSLLMVFAVWRREGRRDRADDATAQGRPVRRRSA